MLTEQKREIRRLRSLGHTQKEVATLMGLAERTIRRAEKEGLPEADPDEEIFEDAEEGWHAHYTKEMGLTVPDSASWAFLVYEESAPEGWEEAMAETGCPLIIGPWHDADTWGHDDPNGRYKKGDKKKSHLHGGIEFPKKISLKKAAMLIQRITHGPVPKIIIDDNAYRAYISHHDKAGNPLPNKAEYDADAVRVYNGWEPKPTEVDKEAMRLKIEKFLIDNRLDNYSFAVHAIKVALGNEYVKIFRENAYHYGKIVEGNRYLSDDEDRQIRAEEYHEERFEIEAEEWWENIRNTVNKEKQNKEETDYESNN